MNIPNHMSWADFSEDEFSDTEEALPPPDPNQKLIIDSINASKGSIYQFKIENLPYKLAGPEEIYTFLQITESQAVIRLQYKGKKFCGFALVSTEMKEIALKVAFKYGNCFEARPILIFYKESETGAWIPQKNLIPNANLSKTAIFDKTFEEEKIVKDVEKKPRVENKGRGRENIMKKDPAILGAVKAKGKGWGKFN